MSTGRKRSRTGSQDSSYMSLQRKEQKLDAVDADIHGFESATMQDSSGTRVFWNVGNTGNSQVTTIGGDYHHHVYETVDEWATLSTHDKVVAIEDRLKTIHDHQLDDKLQGWLAPADTSANFNAAQRQRRESTGSWFISGSNFLQWRDQADLPLWLYGPPGCGKTVLCSTIIHDTISFCRANSLSGYAYFFFDGRTGQTALWSLESLLHSLILQLSDRCDGIPAIVVEMYRACDNGHRQPSLDALQQTLSQLIDGFDDVYIIIDSLDECGEREDLLTWIQALLSQQSTHLHLLVTSRPEPDIRLALASVLTLNSICITAESSKEDIAIFLDGSLSQMRQWDESTRDYIRQTLISGADGIFRWIALQIHELKRCLTLHELTKQLNSLPKGLDETYERILAQSPRPVDLKKFLQWLAFSNERLHIKGLSEVATVDLVNEDGPLYNRQLRYQDPTQVLAVCSGLITEDEGNVRLAHFSVKEYLLSERITAGPAKYFSTSQLLSHSVIAQTCLAYLLTVELPSSLLQYGVNNWIFHILSADQSSGPMQKLLLRFLYSGRKGFDLYGLRAPELRFEVGLFYESAAPIYYASLLGFTQAVHGLIKHGADVAAHGGYYGTALHAAANKDHPEIVRLLLEHGADPISYEGDYHDRYTALGRACSAGHVKIAQLLIMHGADVNARAGNRAYTILQTAVDCGNDEMVKLLLEHGADVNTRHGKFGRTALQLASFYGHTEIAQMLIKGGANVDAKAGRNGTALRAACRKGHPDIVKLLLEHGGDANAMGGRRGSALQAAAICGCRDIVVLLLEHGAEVNASGGRYRTALQAARKSNQMEIAELLSARGAEETESPEASTDEASAAEEDGSSGEDTGSSILEEESQVAELLLDRGTGK